MVAHDSGQDPGLVGFDERWYLDRYKDVADAVRRGEWPSGKMHYCMFGKAEKRQTAPELNEKWYLDTYARAAEEIGAGKAANPADHYLRIGRFRGYLPSRSADRPPNPAGTRSAFGGLWTDQGNALDLIAGKLDLGAINSHQATLLTRWVEDGYVVVEQAVPENLIDRALEDLNKAYAGGFPSLMFDIHGQGRKVAWSPQATAGPAKALDLHWFSEPFRDLIFCERAVEFLQLIFERRVLATQTLAFWRGSGQRAHQDTAYVNYSLPMQFAASWIALEDVQADAGELFYHVGSHRMADYLYAGHYKGLGEGRRVDGSDPKLEDQAKQHLDQIERQAKGMSLKTEKFRARRGDMLFWAADFAHGGSTVSKQFTRKSVATHYCPAELVPTYFEVSPSRQIRSHRGTAWYSSPYYGGPGV